MPCCGSTGCLSCQGKRSTFVEAVIFNIIMGFIFTSVLGGLGGMGIENAMAISHIG